MKIALIGSPTLGRFYRDYDKRIRFGESSGSIHASGGIPAIFEMNSAEGLRASKLLRSHIQNPIIR